MDELALIKLIAGSSPLAAVVMGAAFMIAKVMLRSQKPISELANHIEIITSSIEDIREGLHKLNNTMTKLVVEREHDRRDIEILRDDLKIISGRIDNTQHFCRGQHGNAKN